LGYLLRESKRQGKKTIKTTILNITDCLTTSLSVAEMDKEQVHRRYKDLALVEEAFRCCKTGHLEVRPIYVRKAERTRAHVFVVMLSYLFVRELAGEIVSRAEFVKITKSALRFVKSTTSQVARFR